MEQDHQSTIPEPERATEPRLQPDPHLARLEARLVEAFDDLWDNFVDPAEAYYDADGSRWSQIGGQPGQAGAAGVAFTSEAQLREIRIECRALAVANEFAVNGHENLLTKPASHVASS